MVSKSVRSQRKLWIGTVVVILGVALVGGFAADRFLKGKNHAGVFQMMGQMVRNYPKSWNADPPQLEIVVSDKNYERLVTVVDSARARGVILTHDNSYVKGKLTDIDGTFKVKLRIKGKMTDHVSGRKWSFRVMAREDGDFLGMRRFSLQHPGTRGYLTDWLSHRMMRGEGLVAIRFGYCIFTLNGENLGVYNYEEHFGQELLDYNQRARGPILRFDPDEFWQKRLAWMNKEEVEPGFGSYGRAKIDAYETKAIAADSARTLVFDTAVARIERFRMGLQPASEVFAADLIARHLAHNDLVGGWRSLDWSDVKLYFNPKTGLVEPISYESFSGFPTEELAGAYRFTGAFRSSDELHTQWLKDTVLFKRYIHHLERFMQPAYMDSTFAALAPALDSASAIIYGEFPWKELDRKIYYSNQKVIAKLLAEGVSIAASWKVSPEGVELSLTSKGALPLSVDGLFAKDGSRMELQGARILPSATREGAQTTVVLSLPNAQDLSAAVLRYRIPGSGTVHELKLGAAGK